MNTGNKLSLLISLLFLVGTIQAQSTSPKPDTNNPLTQLNQANLEYKASSEGVIHLQELEISKAAAEVEQLRLLVSEGLVAKNELADKETKVSELRANLEAMKQKIADSERVVAELNKVDELAKGQPSETRSLVKPTILRYNGTAHWVLGRLTSVQQFFSTTFGRALPTSAVGQSATHKRLGWNHRNAVDVPVHPDSVEGKALIGYLQENKIPFLAFRGAVPGVSTGPHIHIGMPSQRI
jgi:hypothetical protein